MLIEELDLNRIKVIGCNTDSVTVIVKKHQLDLYHRICKEWEEKTKMNLDHDEFQAIYESSCNNYIAVSDTGYVKSKGFFVDDLNLLKGYEYPIVKKALILYFTEGIDYKETIMNHSDILDFCMSTRMGFSKKAQAKFEAYWNGEKQQKTNRYYASKGGKTAYLYKSANGFSFEHVLADSGVTLLNQLDDLPIKKRNINYSFYIKKAKEIQQAIEPTQLSMFN